MKTENQFHQTGTREEKEDHMRWWLGFSFVVLAIAVCVNGFGHAWKDWKTWLGMVCIGAEWILFCCSYKNTSMCDIDGRTSKARNMRYFGYLLSFGALALDIWSISDLIEKGVEEETPEDSDTNYYSNYDTNY
eukprot:63395_1